MDGKRAEWRRDASRWRSGESNYRTNSASLPRTETVPVLRGNTKELALPDELLKEWAVLLQSRNEVTKQMIDEVRCVYACLHLGKSALEE